MSEAGPQGPGGPVSALITLRLGRWNIKLSRFTYLLILGVIVGLATGLVAVLFRLASHHSQVLLSPYHGPQDSPSLISWGALRRLLVPACGGLFVGFLLFRIGQFTTTHNIPAILQALASGQVRLRPRMMVPPALSVVTIATGGSGGGEGPIAEIGAVMGNNVGRLLGAPPRMLKTLIGSGVAAGIAAVFNAPIAGVFFALEVILRNYQIASFTPIAVAAVVAAVLAQSLLGSHAVIALPPPGDLPLRLLPLFALLGLVCGVLSLVYIHAIARGRAVFSALPMPRWLKPALGGLGVGLVGWLFPQALGEGYAWLPDALAGRVGVAALVCLLVAKMLTTTLTLGSGNPAGTFAPAIFIGVMGGAAFGALASALGLAVPVSAFAICGLAGLIAGALGAPVTAIMMTLQLAGPNAGPLLLPLMTTVALSAFVMSGRGHVSVYTFDMQREGVDIDSGREGDPLSMMRVGQMVHRTGFEELAAAMPVRAALDHAIGSGARWFVVKGPAGTYLGICALHDMRLALRDSKLAGLLTLGDITDGSQPRLVDTMTLREALDRFRQSELEALPVFTRAGGVETFCGVLGRQDALDAYTELTPRE